jgi:oxalate decarboxylase/phosphoglucose isomerase-like protein (cupin superfamily)
MEDQMSNQLTVGSDEVAVVSPSEATDGALLAIEVRIPAGGGPPGLHRHPAAEIYRVERGELAIYLEQEAGAVTRIAAQSGDVVAIEGGREHTVRNESAEDAVAYVVFAPGAEMERFIRAAHELADPEPADVAALAHRHGISGTRALPRRSG